MAERLKRAIAWAFAAAALVWVLHDVDPHDLIQRLVIQQPAWLFLAILADILSYLTQGVRWRLFLSPIGNLTITKATQAIYAGLFVNEMVPMRFGEVARAYLAARWLSVRFRSVLPSLAFERLTDGVWLALGFGVVTRFAPLPGRMTSAAQVLEGALLIAAVALALVFWFGRSSRFHWVRRVAQSIHAASTSRGCWVAFFISSFILILQTMAFWFVIKAYALPVGFWIGAAVFLIVHLGTVIPNAPANVGAFQFFVVAGLTFFGLDKATAAAFSVAVFLILTIPLWLIGSIALGRTGLSLANIRLRFSQRDTVNIKSN